MIAKAEIFDALQHYFPEGFSGFEPGADSPESYEEYLSWITEGESALSEEEIIAGAEATRFARARRGQMRAQRDVLRAKWATLPAWIRGPYTDRFSAAERLLDARDYDAAVELIRYTAPAPDYDPEKVAVFLRVRAELVTALDALRSLAEG